MKEKLLSYITGIFTFLLFPYLITILINGADTALLTRSPDIESCVPAALSTQIGKDYEPEAIKSQAVIARTNLYRKIREEGFPELLKELKEDMENTEGSGLFMEKIYEEAAEETEGKILLSDGELKLVPYHPLSGGKTRDGEEVFHDPEYSYLRSVDSPMDKDAPDYLNSTYISCRQLPEDLTVEERDSAGYVMSLSTGGNSLEGEAFCKGMDLASANFTIQKIGEEVRFLCKGKGHGLGFSQYGGNELARSGENWEQILKTYFPEMTLGNCRDF